MRHATDQNHVSVFAFLLSINRLKVPFQNRDIHPSYPFVRKRRRMRTIMTINSSAFPLNRVLLSLQQHGPKPSNPTFHILARYVRRRFRGAETHITNDYAMMTAMSSVPLASSLIRCGYYHGRRPLWTQSYQKHLHSIFKHGLRFREN